LGDSLEEAIDYLYSQGWTDGLPVIPPTEERVRAMVEYTGRDPQEVVARVAPAYAEATVEKIAINAVMAGCRPEYMPVVIAAVRAVAEPRFNLNGIQATTNPVGPMVIINGPVRRELGVNCGAGVMGPGWRANATIGRALRLILLNIGGARPDEVDKSTQGMPGKYTFCIGENEEESPWPSLSVERGFDPSRSTVTVVGAQATTNIIEINTDAGDILKTVVSTMRQAGCNNFVFGLGEPLLLLNPPHAKAIAAAGYSKDDLKRLLHREVRLPLDWFSRRAQERILADGRVEEGMVAIARRWEDIMVVVAGGGGGYHSTFIPTFGDTWSVTVPL
jgi:hypothetical protein